jgi:hypothetical protein
LPEIYVQRQHINVLSFALTFPRRYTHLAPSVPHVAVEVWLATVQFIIWVPASSVPGFLPLETGKKRR